MIDDKPISILVVEDSEPDFHLLKRTLNETSFKSNIKWAESYEQAKDFLNQEHFDVALIDYRLGIHTGIEVISYINSHFTFVPTILLTGLKDPSIDKKALQSGAFDYLTKDQYNADHLDRSIRYAIEKARVLKSLKESENKYRTLFENATEYVFILDESHHILDLNKSAIKFLECKGKEEISGANIFEFLEANIYAKNLTSLLDENISEIHSLSEIEIKNKKNGKRYYCILNFSRIDPEKKVIQLVLHDITERKINEQKEKLLEKQALTGKVARIIAHEIKNPLTNIQLSLSELKSMMKSVVADEPDESADFLDIIDRNSRRINKLIEDLLNATRLDTMEVEMISMEDLWNETLSLTKDRIKLKEITITKNIQPITFKGDKDKLIIAFTNLIVNAIEAMPEKDGKLDIKSTMDDKFVIITIRDNGKGISPEHQAKLFEPFFTSKKGGTGLGLSATYNIITRHNGNIKVNSKVDEGTEFIITLPLEKR